MLNTTAPTTAVIFPSAGAAVPYWNDVNQSGQLDATENYVNSDSFQIISAGMDGLYGYIKHVEPRPSDSSRQVSGTTRR